MPRRAFPTCGFKTFSMTVSLTPSAAMPDACRARKNHEHTLAFSASSARQSAALARDILPNTRVPRCSEHEVLVDRRYLRDDGERLRAQRHRVALLIFWVRSGCSVHTSPLISLRFIPTTSPQRWPLNNTQLTRARPAPPMPVAACQSVLDLDVRTACDRARSPFLSA